MVRKVDWKIYIIIAIITSMFFITGIYTGFVLSKEKIDIISEQVGALDSGLKDTELTLLFLSFFGNKSCDLLRHQLNSLEIDSNNLRKDVEFYEATEKLTDPSYITVKKDYMSLMLRHWLYYKEMKEECSTNSTVILYFYSNKYCDSCEDQGIILTYLKREQPDNIAVFSFDTDLEVKMIDYIGNLYNFTTKKIPVLIIEDEKYEGFLNKEELKTILCEKNRILC